MFLIEKTEKYNLWSARPSLLSLNRSRVTTLKKEVQNYPYRKFDQGSIKQKIAFSINQTIDRTSRAFLPVASLPLDRMNCLARAALNQVSIQLLGTC